MLTLTRRLGEKIVIGADIEVTVVEIDRGKIRLGITAPRSVVVKREELLTLAERVRRYEAKETV